MLKEVLEGLKSLLAYFQTERHDRAEKQDAALLAIYTAANETKLYIQRSKTGDEDRNAEEELSRLWTKTAVQIRHFNHQLADRCLIKGNYWVNPGSSEWTSERIRETGIDIDEVFEEARALLKQRA